VKDNPEESDDGFWKMEEVKHVVERLSVADSAWHRLFCEGVPPDRGSLVAGRTMENIRRQLRVFQGTAEPATDKIAAMLATINEHREIREAIAAKKKDFRRIEAAVHTHIEGTGRRSGEDFKPTDIRRCSVTPLDSSTK
jgi:DNA-binding GntR family transcriptional regulator